MNEDKLARAEKRKAAQARQKLAWRALSVSAAGWILSIIALPIGSAQWQAFASPGIRFLVAYSLATISIVAATLALAMFKPWKRLGMRSFALALVALALILGDAYVLAWKFRL